MKEKTLNEIIKENSGVTLETAFEVIEDDNFFGWFLEQEGSENFKTELAVILDFSKQIYNAFDRIEKSE